MAAEQEKLNDAIDALSNLAAGEEVSPESSSQSTPAPVLPQEPAQSSAQPVAMGVTEDAKEIAALAKVEESPDVPKHIRVPRAVGHHYQQFMIPLLILLGIALAVLGAISVHMAQNAPPEDGSMVDAYNVPMRPGALHIHGRWLGLAAFVLAAAMIGGAVFFHIQGKRARAHGH